MLLAALLTTPAPICYQYPGTALKICQPAACQPGYSPPNTAARDLAAFQLALKSSLPDLDSITATAVHGHEVDVTDSLVEAGTSQSRKYFQGGSGAVSDRLRSLWNETYRKLHPDDPDRAITTLQVRDRFGHIVMVISVEKCAVP